MPIFLFGIPLAKLLFALGGIILGSAAVVKGIDDVTDAVKEGKQNRSKKAEIFFVWMV